MTLLRRTALVPIVLLAFLVVAPLAAADSLAGLWAGTVAVNGVDIPFQIEFSGKGDRVKGAFVNGGERVTSTAGRFDGASLTLSFDQYAEKLRATLKGGELAGTIEGKFQPGPPQAVPFHAKPYAAAEAPAGTVPAIDGLWEIEINSSKGESAWRFIVHQKGADVSAAILRVDGDTGALTGRYLNGKFVLSHFSGERPYLMDVTPQSDGTLAIALHDYSGKRDLLAYRPADARAKGLPEPADPTQHTKMGDPKQPFAFSFPDLDGRTVSNTDARFRGKVLIVVITGSWCPNCHDEAPFLAALYRKYRDRGLEIVALDFEDADQIEHLTRLRAFIRHYGIEYATLVGGDPDQVNRKIPQLVNLNSWPTTVFIGRDGLVQSIHAGFAGAASGEFNNRLKDEITARVETMLAESAPVARESRLAPR